MSQNTLRSIFAVSALAAAVIVSTTHARAAEQKPNIVFILADDLGYGDVKCLNPTARSRRRTSIASPRAA